MLYVLYVYVHIYTHIYSSEFQLKAVPACPMLGMNCQAVLTGAGRYYAGGANVATEACGREKKKTEREVEKY